MRPTNRGKVVLTGAWGGGKSTLIRELLGDPEFGGRLIPLPEAAPLVRGMGFRIMDDRFEKRVLDMQHALERIADRYDGEEDFRMILSHRGSLDAWAFWCWQGREPGEFFKMAGTSLEAELARYDAVILLETTAGDLPRAFEEYRRKNKRPDADEALRLEYHLDQAWNNHPRFFRIGNQGISWAEKSILAGKVIRALLRTEPLSRDGVNRKLSAISYPSNHQYQVGPYGRLEPGPTAAARLRELEDVLSQKQYTSLIDVGCARGMFLFWASRKYDLKRAIGIEAAKDQAEACRNAALEMNVPATILHASLLECHAILPPADLVFVFHCYHYLYFGSEYGVPGTFDHNRIFRIFSEICTDTLIFANSLFMKDEKTESLRKKAVPQNVIQNYNKDSIMTQAGHYFDLEPVSSRDERPFVIMRRK